MCAVTVSASAYMRTTLTHIMLIVLGIFFTIAAAFSVNKNVPVAVPLLASHSVSEVRAAMVALIKEAGPEKAYQAFLASYASLPVDEQHNAAHLFGESLYEAVGTKAISACDSSFNFGCYHGFFPKAIQQEGSAVIPVLDDACKNALRSSACQHGIGHGILEYLGHDKLVDALELCGRTDDSNGPGCISGVFMEYNVPLQVMGDGTYKVAPRTFDATKPYVPCEDVPDIYKEACYQALPQWWRQTPVHDNATVDSLCSSLTEPTYRTRCLEGLGNVVASDMKYVAKDIVAACRSLSSSESVQVCIASSAWACSKNTNTPSCGEAICETIDANIRDMCLKGI